MSYVAMAESICPVCGTKHTDSGELLIDKRLKDIPKDKRLTGYHLCKEHQDLADKGFIALVGVDPEKSQVGGDTLKMENAHRTGNIAHLKREAFSGIFGTECPDREMMFCEDAVITQLQKMIGKPDELH